MPTYIQACGLHALERLIDIYSYYGFCLTSEGDDLGQWRAYANQGQGVAIGFNLENLIKSAQLSPLALSTKATKVEYGKEAILPYAKELLTVMSEIDQKTTVEFWSDPEMLFQDSSAYAKEFQKAIETFSTNCYNIKNPSFLLEKETRITQETVFTASSFSKFFAREGRIVPYYDVEITPECIDCVVAGPQLEVSKHDISRVLSSWSGDLFSTNIYRSISSSRR